MENKALSVQQPYALLEVMGIKDIENRTWNTNHRGRIYIHACGKRTNDIKYHLTDVQKKIVSDKQISSFLQNDSMYSAILGYVDLIDVVENHSSIWALPGHYHWILANPVMFESPITSVKGKLNLWPCGEYIPMEQKTHVKLLFLDVETTGLDPDTNGIHQLGGEIVVDGEVEESFDFKIRPFNGCIINNEALAVSKTTNLDFLKYQIEEHVYINFTAMITKYLDYKNTKDKFIIVGWRNPGFDDLFLKAFFERNTRDDIFDSLFWSNSIDVKVLASDYLLSERPQMKSFSLAPVAEHLGIEIESKKLHRASYDAYLTRKVYEIVRHQKLHYSVDLAKGDSYGVNVCISRESAVNRKTV